MPQLQSAFGLFVLVLIAWLASTSRRRFPWRIVISLEEATMAGTLASSMTGALVGILYRPSLSSPGSAPFRK